MKKLRTVLTIIAIVASIGGALATGTGWSCAYQPQYRQVQGMWVQVYGYGYSYFCASAPDYCTYFRPNPIFQPNLYVPCREGEYIETW